MPTHLLVERHGPKQTLSRLHMHAKATMACRFFSLEVLVAVVLGLGAGIRPHWAVAQHTTGDTAEVRQLLEERNREIKRVLGDRETFTDEQRERLRHLVNDGIDFAAMGRTALGSFWEDVPRPEREEFVNVFSQIVRNQSLSNLDIYRSEVVFEHISVEGDVAKAITKTTYEGVPIQVEYVLGHTDGQWWVQDIVLDDVSTAEGYARSFQTFIRKRGFDALMNSLRKKLDGMRS